MPRCNLTQSGTWRGAGDAIEGQLAVLGYMDAIEENLIDDQMQVVLGYVEWCWGRPKAAGLVERSGEELHRSSKRRRMRRGEATLPAAPLPDRWVDVDTVNDTVTVANTVANTVAIDLCSDAEIDMYADMPPLTISSDEEPGPDIEMTGFIPPQVENDVCALRASRYGLKAHVFQRMVFLGVPCFILNCIWLLYNDVNCTDARDLDYVEFMSGEGNIFGSMLEMMLHACGYDNKLHPILQNLLCPTGCLCAIQLLRRLAPGGGTSWALVCASWVWMSRSKTRRSLARPLGPDDPAERIAAVVDGNQMVSIFAALLLWIVSMGDVQWLLEQPSSSLLVHHPRIQAIQMLLQRERKWHSVHTWMGAFGGPTPKSTRLWSSSARFLQGMHRTLPRSVINTMCQESGIATYTVNPERRALGLSSTTGAAGLHDSQAYPVEFGRQVARSFLANRLVDDTSDYQPGVMPAPSADVWADAGFDRFAAALGIPADRLAV